MAIFDTYVFTNRADAAKLAAEVTRAQREAQGSKAGFLSVSWAKLKSGITRQVKVPASNTKAELSAMKPVVSSLQELKEKELCTRKTSPFDVPEGFSWSHGNAKNMSRHIVVRHWTMPGKKDSSLHTALSMKDKIAGLDDYATWTPRRIRLINWSKSKNPFKRLLAPVRMKLDDLFTQDFPAAPPNYREDKGLYLRTDTKFRLQDGVNARRLMARSAEITDSTVKNANYTPLSHQKTSSKDSTEWQRRAEKHYLPCIGFDKHQRTGRETFTMFGLDLDSMRERWEAVQNPEHPEHYYKQFSKEQNCSGMCLSLLKAGGADLFYDYTPSLVTTQSDMEKYSAKLLEVLDKLNDKANDLDNIVNSYNVPDEPDLSLASICEKLESLPIKYSMPDKWKTKIQEIANHIRTIDKPSQTIQGLTPVAALLTNSLADLYGMTEDHPHLVDRFEPALHAFKILKNRMEDAYKEQIEWFEDPYFE